MSVASKGQHKRVSQIEVGQRQGDRVRALRVVGISNAWAQHAWVRAERENSPLLVIVKVFDRRPPVFAPELEGVTAMQPGEIVEYLIALAGTPAGNAESGCT